MFNLFQKKFLSHNISGMNAALESGLLEMSQFRRFKEIFDYNQTEIPNWISHLFIFHRFIVSLGKKGGGKLNFTFMHFPHSIVPQNKMRVRLLLLLVLVKGVFSCMVYRLNIFIHQSL